MKISEKIKTLINSRKKENITLALELAKSTNDFETQCIAIHYAKGWNGLRAFLRKSGRKYELIDEEYGLETNRHARKEKMEAMEKNPLCFHLHSLGIHKKGYMYNRIRTRTIHLLD